MVVRDCRACECTDVPVCGFVWSDGTPMDFTFWGPEQPDNDVNLSNIFLLDL